MIYMLVAKKLKLPVYGVNLPNLFVMVYKQEEGQFYINAFNRGLVFSKKEIDDYIDNLKLPQNEIYYEPCSHLEIVKRVLRNLAHAHEKLGHAEKVEEIRQLSKILQEKE